MLYYMANRVRMRRSEISWENDTPGAYNGVWDMGMAGSNFFACHLYFVRCLFFCFFYFTGYSDITQQTILNYFLVVFTHFCGLLGSLLLAMEQALSY
jgi:hypothetical protein